MMKETEKNYEKEVKGESLTCELNEIGDEQKKYTFEVQNGAMGFVIRDFADCFRTEVALNADNTVEISKYKGRYGQINNKLKGKNYWKIKASDICAAKIELKPQISLMIIATVLLAAGLVLSPLYFILFALSCFGLVKKTVVLQLQNGTDIFFYISRKDTNKAYELINAMNVNIGNVRRGGVLRKPWFYILVILCVAVVGIMTMKEEADNTGITNEFEETQPNGVVEAETPFETAKKIIEKEIERENKETEFQHKAIENNISVAQLYRQSSAFEGKEVYFGGTVLQTIYGQDNPNAVELRVEVVGEQENDVIYVFYELKPNDLRILEGDWVDIYGTYEGLITYESTSGMDITIPAVQAEFLYYSVSVEPGDYLASPEYEMLSEKIHGRFVDDEGKEIEFPVEQEPYYAKLRSVKKINSYLYGIYQAEMGCWDEEGYQPYYRIVVIDDGAIVVYDEDTKEFGQYKTLD